MKERSWLAGLDVDGVLLVEVAQRLQPGVTVERGVVEGDLGVERLELLDDRAVRRRLADDGQGVDLDQVGVVGDHRREHALGDGHEVFEMRTKAQLERQPAGLVIEQSQVRVGVHRGDGRWIGFRDLLDLHAALGRAHHQHALRATIDDGREVDLVDDLGRGRDEHLADRDALDVHAQDGVRHLFGLGGTRCQLHAAGLAAPSDEHLRLDHDLGRSGREKVLRGGSRVRTRARDGPGRHRQALGDEERLRVGFLDLHGRPMVQGSLREVADLRERGRMHPVTLRFLDGEMERDYQLTAGMEGVGGFRATLLASFLAWLAAALLLPVGTDLPFWLATLVPLAMAMLDASTLIKAPTGELSLRVGVHSGPAVGGVIGRSKFAFDIWGDTVNVASRLQSQGVPGRIHVSEATWQLIADAYEAEPRGVIELRGHGPMRTYLVTGPVRAAAATTSTA